MFSHKVQIRFRDADPAGIMFFARVFDYAHDVYEDFICSLGLSYEDYFQNPQMAVPLVRAEADYKKPMQAGQSYQVLVKVSRIGKSSFSLSYEIHQEELICAIVQTHHVFIDPRTKTKMAIPESIRTSLQQHS